MDSFERDWDRFMNDAGKFWKSTANQATGGKSMKELKNEMMTPIEDTEMQQRNELYFYVKKVIDSAFQGEADWLRELATVDKVLAQLGEIYLHDGKEFEESVKKAETARTTLVSAKVAQFLKGRFTEIRDKHTRLGNLSDRATKLQYKVEQLTRVYNNEDASKVFGYVKKQQWLEKAQDELDVAKPEYFQALDEFMVEFHTARRELFQLWKEDLHAYEQSLVESFGGGIEDPGTLILSYDELDETLNVLKYRRKQQQQQGEESK